MGKFLAFRITNQNLTGRRDFHAALLLPVKPGHVIGLILQVMRVHVQMALLYQLEQSSPELIQIGA